MPDGLRSVAAEKEDLEKVTQGIFTACFEKQDQGQEPVSLCDKSKCAFRRAKLL